MEAGNYAVAGQARYADSAARIGSAQSPNPPEILAGVESLQQAILALG